jgi:hypothetical protein
MTISLNFINRKKIVSELLI